MSGLSGGGADPAEQVAELQPGLLNFCDVKSGLTFSAVVSWRRSGSDVAAVDNHITPDPGSPAVVVFMCRARIYAFYFLKGPDPLDHRGELFIPVSALVDVVDAESAGFFNRHLRRRLFINNHRSQLPG